MLRHKQGESVSTPVLSSSNRLAWLAQQAGSPQQMGLLRQVGCVDHVAYNAAAAGHLDFIWGYNAVHRVYGRVLELLKMAADS
jgi:hypothetical protein